jgi:branched-chain amino acid aminotransferase
VQKKKVENEMANEESAETPPTTFWLDGRIVPESEATISVLDHGLLYGDGLFEGMRIFERRLFRLSDHMHRLSTGAKAIGLELPGGLPAIEKAVLDTARAHDGDDAYVRLIVTRGVGELGVDPIGCREPRVICIASAIRMYPEAKRQRGLDLVTSSLRRPQAGVLDPGVKSLNYLNSVLAKREARLRGADEALVLNAQGQIAEASGANVFIVCGDAVVTPPPSDGALPGITRKSVLEIARREGLQATERTIGRVDLWGADEAFLTGSGARIVPIATLDGERVGDDDRDRPGPITQRLMDAFGAYARELGTPI